MEEPEDMGEHQVDDGQLVVPEGGARRVGRRLARHAQDGLAGLDVPVAVLAPEEAVQGGGGVAEAVAGEGLVHLAHGDVEAGQDPAVVRREQGRVDFLLGGPGVQLAEAAGVPELVAEVAAQLNGLLVKEHVLPQRRRAHHPEPQRVRPVLGDQVQRVRRVAQGLRHLPPLLVPDDPGEIDVPEREIPHVLEARHDHPRHPEEDDVGPGHEVRRGIERPQRGVGAVGGPVARPAHRGKRPQPRAEPRVEDVRVLDPSVACRRLQPAVDLRPPIPHGDAVPPPKLPADAPVLDAGHPVVVHLRPTIREETHGAVGHATLGGLHAGVAQEPLLREAGLDGHVGALAEPDVVDVGLGLHECARPFEQLGRLLAPGEAIQARQVRARPRRELAVGRQHVDHRQLVAQANVEVRRVMRRRHLEHARPKLEVHVVVRDDRDDALLLGNIQRQRTPDVLAHQVRIARVLRVHRHRRVRRDRLRARYMKPFCSFMTTSSSDNAVRDAGHQFTMRLPR